jgi:hypothetical protein
MCHNILDGCYKYKSTTITVANFAINVSPPEIVNQKEIRVVGLKRSENYVDIQANVWLIPKYREE